MNDYTNNYNDGNYYYFYCKIKLIYTVGDTMTRHLYLCIIKIKAQKRVLLLYASAYRNKIFFNIKI